MSIDAVVDRVEYTSAGCELHLRGRPQRGGKVPPGQSMMIVLNPPPHLDVLVGMELWGNSSQIYVGDRYVFDRDGYTRLLLRDLNQG